MFGNYTNSKEIRIIKGIPAVIHTDSFGDILTVEPATNVEDYKTRNYLYNTDMLVYEKFINNQYKYSDIDPTILTAIKGKKLEDAETLFK